ncbi:Fur family transcriptional regulator [Acidocella sp. KAb 2-4]|uniref:Fur family transcriptional regulator n=1 Tax=Acidocella sp. KAb 2-4 TaxID=2885158 RepID=UPI001D06E093|nr:Fur family transcriptional regulator [Acidocella sp. KAb 2-4]MCB5944816.1 transcriptional repressor [Acidocella sp. KAb 2-4]
MAYHRRMAHHHTARARDIPAQLQAAQALCAKHGTQLTALRREVLELILRAEAPVTAYQLLDQLKAVRRSAVPPTVYRALDFLLANRLIHRIERLNAFIPCAEAEHDHADAQFLICRQCGAVTEIEDPGISAALARAASAHGFRPAHAIVELDGLCAACASL